MMGDEEECHDIGSIQARIDGPTDLPYKQGIDSQQERTSSSGIAEKECRKDIYKTPQLYQVLTRPVTWYPTADAHAKKSMESSGALDAES